MEVKKVLLADDDADDREIFERVLGKNGELRLLTTVENGLEVIRYLDELRSDEELPDLIILDHNMPRMNGTETLEALKSTARYKEIAVVVYSTFSDQRLTQKCMSLGAAMVVSKPATMREYEAVINQFLELIP